MLPENPIPGTTMKLIPGKFCIFINNYFNSGNI
jgi:hypothetical protein